MGIRDTFKVSWENAVMQSALNREVEILPEKRIIVRNVHIGKLEFGEFIVVYGDSEYPVLVVTRFPLDAMLLSAYIHLFEQRKRVEQAGIKCDIHYERGLIQCTYTRVGSDSVLSSLSC